MAVMMRSMLEVADNSGARKLQMILPLGGSTGLNAGLGDIITAAVKESVPEGQVQKGKVVKAVIVRTRKEHRRRDGTYIRFDSNAAVLINDAGEPVGTPMRTVSTENKRVDLRRNDTVKVITGRDKGKEGRVLRVFPNDAKLLVEHVMMVKKHVRPNPQRNIKGGIAEQESRIAISNVQLVCPTCGPVRIGHEVRGDRKVRVCKKCGTTLDK